MNIKDRASRIRQLSKDPVYLDVIKEIREKQVNVFLNPSSSPENLAEAHNMIRALDQFDTHFTSVLAEEAVYDKQQLKGQHRGRHD